MSRFLFVVPPLTGHTNPAVGVATELLGRGHDIAWVAHGAVVGHLLPSGATVFDPGDRFLHRAAELLDEREKLRGASALKFLWQEFLCPLAIDMAPAVTTALRTFEPDVVVADQQALAGGILADRSALRWATSATTTSELVDPLAGVPKVAEWITASWSAVELELGVSIDLIGRHDPRFSRHLILAYTTEAFTGPIAHDGPLTFVGPVLNGRVDDRPLPSDFLDRHAANVLISLGTVSAGGTGDRFLRAAVDAAANQPYGAIVVGRRELFGGGLPDNVIVRESVPQLALLDRLDAVVSHGGHNTVSETLSHGLPLVVAPIRDDQPIIATQVVNAGAGVRVSFPRVSATELRAAIHDVLITRTYRAAAARIADSFIAAGGEVAAAKQLEALAAGVSAGPTAHLAAH